MGKVISLINTTPDGFADAGYGIIDEEYFEFIHRILSDTGTIAFGRNSFELFQSIWPSRLENGLTDWHKKMARALADMPKTVYSTTLQTTTWTNSTIARKIDPDLIDSCRNADTLGFLTLASLNLVANLTALNLIDEFYFCIQPLIAGKGDVRLFDNVKLEKTRALRYVDSKSLKSGVHIVHYERVN
ncbi:MAG TPA: dihydrofolate reductase family protein [Chryseolinea sp.]|nr:dihydrofolate reductase family protein [Chryseolinea sp.]